METGTITSNIGNVEIKDDSLIKLDTKLFNSFLTKITNFDFINTPVHKIFNIVSNYNIANNEVNITNSLIITTKTDITANIGDIVTIGNSTTVDVEILYTEGKTTLIKVNESDLINLRNLTITNEKLDGQDIVFINNNLVALKPMFHNVSGPYKTSDAEYLDIIKELDINIVSSLLETKSRKVRSSFTQEVIQDINSQFSLEKDDILQQEANELITYEIETEILKYLRDISKKYNTLDLSKYANGNENIIIDASTELYANVRYIINQLVGNLKRRKDVFIIADSDTASLLMANPMFRHINDENDTNLVGTLGIYKVYTDLYTHESDNYVMVGLKDNQNKVINKSGLIVRVYNELDIVNTIDSETGNEVSYNILRYGYTRNPQDINEDESIFFSSFNVDMTDLLSYNV